MSVSKQVAKAIARDAVQMEAKNQKILTSNLLAAREKLLENPDKWQHHTFGDLLDETMTEYEAAVIEEFPIEETIRHGQKEGQLFAGMDMGAAKGANFWQWTPVLPSHAIAMAESEFANTIGKATSDFKATALRTVQQGLAMGSGTQDMMDDLLGVGLSGAKGKDGKFRQATNRAEAIARTVSNDLINRGAMITYGQIDRISPELGLQKIWQTLSDNRTSERCLSLSGQKRELNEDFQAGDGWTGQNPPAHPYCRSRVTSRAANKNYTKDIDERFAKMPPVAAPTSELLADPLSDPLPKKKKVEAEDTAGLGTKPIKTPKVTKPVVEDVPEPAPKPAKEKKAKTPKTPKVPVAAKEETPVAPTPIEKPPKKNTPKVEKVVASQSDKKVPLTYKENEKKLAQDRQAWVNISSEKDVQLAEENIKRILEDANLMIRVPSSSTIEKIIESERFKTQFETGKSRGVQNQKKREEVESALFGEKSVPPEQRAIYGYLGTPEGDKKNENGGKLDGYGQISVKLKDSVKDRSTMMGGDSLMEMTDRNGKIDTSIGRYTSKVTDPKIGSFGSAHNLDLMVDRFGMDYDDETEQEIHPGVQRLKAIQEAKTPQDLRTIGGDYLEAQMHGQVLASDIEEITFYNKNKPTPASLEWAKNNNVKIIQDTKERNRYL